MTTWLSFFWQKAKRFFQIPRKKKKTNLQRFNFPQTITLDSTSKLLTILPKSIRKLFFAVNTRKPHICAFSSFKNEKTVLLDSEEEVLTTSWVSFAIRHKTSIQNARRKTKLQKTIFPQNVTVVHTSTLLRSLLKNFANCFSL